MLFWKNINHLMKKRGMSFSALSKAVKIHSGKKPSITRLKANIEGRQSVSPSIDTALALAKIFSVSFDELNSIDLEERERLMF